MSVYDEAIFYIKEKNLFFLNIMLNGLYQIK